MALEDLTGDKYIDDLNSSNPESGDTRTEGDDHIRGVKNVLKKTFPSVTGAVSASQNQLNFTNTTAGIGEAGKAIVVNGALQVTMAGITWSDLGIVTTVDINGGTIDGAEIGAASAATVTGAALGTAVTGVTQTTGNDTTLIATTAFVQQEIDAIPSVSYGGQVASDGTGTNIPSGWSSVRAGEGRYTITHNLGNTNYAVVATPTASTTIDTLCYTVSVANNSVEIRTFDVSLAALDDEAFHFVITVIA